MDKPRNKSRLSNQDRALPESLTVIVRHVSALILIEYAYSSWIVTRLGCRRWSSLRQRPREYESAGGMRIPGRRMHHKRTPS